MSDKFEATFHPAGQVVPVEARNATETGERVSRALPDGFGSGEALVQQIAEAIHGARTDSTPLCDDEDDLESCWPPARAVLPLVEAQVAPLRDEMERADEELAAANYGLRMAESRLIIERRTRKAAESALRQVREDLTALADEWESDAIVGEFVADAEAGIRWTPRFYFAPKIRAILDSARVGAADTQPEGAGEGWPCRRCGSQQHTHANGACPEPVCAKDVGDPSEVCRCLLPRGHAGLHECKHKHATPTAGGKVDTAPEAHPEDVECCASGSCEVCQPHRYPDLLRNSREEQRRLDNEPCPKCGGDRLRPNFTATDACHAKRVRPADTAPESGEGR